MPGSLVDCGPREAHEIFLLWYYRIGLYRSYVKRWKISPSHYLNQDLATVWLDK
jgi:peptide/nickel transport system substrate-binding protein